MKKLSIILALALMMVSAFAAVAFADPDHPTGTFGTGIYLPADPATYPIHSSYTANTDACAACHNTHTGAGTALLQWDTSTQGVTAACMACHDGTVAKTYDVKNGVFTANDDNSTGHKNSGGLFAGYAGKTDSASQHAAFGTNLIYSAPGGKGSAGADAKGEWTSSEKFGCASCHTPHGLGANKRILDPNPNWIQTGGADPAGAGYVAPVQNETATAVTPGTVYKTAGRPILGYPYSKTTAVKVDNNPVTTGFKWSLDANGDANLTFNPAISVSAVVTVSYTPALVVKMDIQNKLNSAESVQYVSGMNTFCGACHTDYNTSGVVKPHENLNGSYTSKTRHPVGFEKSTRAKLEGRGLKFEQGANWASDEGVVMCLTCHYAHGVDQGDVWAKTAVDTGIAAYNNPEIGGSSKLKRLPNMATCEACHEKSVGNYNSAF